MLQRALDLVHIMDIMCSMHIAHIRELDLNLLLALHVLFNEGSVTCAAHTLGLTQSAMSHSLRRLRDFFGDPLFVRSGGMMKPTPKGEQVAQVAQSIMGRVERDLLSQRRFEPATTEGVLNLCMTDLGELTLLPTLVRRLAEQAPNFRIKSFQVPLSQVDEVLESSEADLYLGVLTPPPDHLYRQKLFSYTLSAMVSRMNVTIGERVSLKTAEAMRHVVVRPLGKRGLGDSLLKAAGLRQRPYLTTPHWLSVPMILAQDPGLIAFVPRALALIFENYNVTRTIKPPVDFDSLPIYQYWHPKFQHHEASIWLRGLVKTCFDGHREEDILPVA